eukprot:scaffold5664_cov94-Skeletonema_dohrnii-CCMP3373.AAC.2
MAEEFIYMGEPYPVVPPGATRVIVDASVNIIPADAFYKNRHIEEVKCHVDVKTVGRWAFYECPSLRKVIMPGVEVVMNSAFKSCKALSYVKCDKLEIIREGAFDGCESLGSINLPSAKVIESLAFWGCTALMNVKFGKELESIGRAAFAHCTSLERITIPLKDGIITYNDCIFKGCKKLVHVDLVEGAVLRDTIDALQLDEWRNDMKDKLGAINQSLPNTPAGAGFGDTGGKARAVRMWISSVLHKIVDYKAQHRRLLNEAATILQHALPNDIVNENVLPFLELPSHTFEGEEDITSSNHNADILERLRDNDPDFTHISIDDVLQDEGDFVVREGDDLGWLGYFVGRSNELDLDISDLLFPNNLNIDSFLRGLGHNRSIQTLGISTDIGDHFHSLAPLLRNNNSIRDLTFTCFNGGSTAADSSMEINVHVDGLTIPITLTHEKCTSTSSGELCKDFVENSLTNVDPRLILQILTKLSPAERSTHYVIRYGDGYSSIVHVEWSSADIAGFVRLPLVPACIDVNMTLKPRKRGAPTKAKPHLPLQPAGISLPTSMHVDLCIALVSTEEPPYPSDVARTSVVHLKEHGKFPGCVGSYTFSVEAADGQNNILPETVHEPGASTAAAAIVVTTATAAAGKKRKAPSKDQKTTTAPTKAKAKS